VPFLLHECSKNCEVSLSELGQQLTLQFQLLRLLPLASLMAKNTHITLKLRAAFTGDVKNYLPATHHFIDSLIDDVLGFDMMKFEMRTQLFDNCCFSNGWWSMHAYSYWLTTKTFQYVKLIPSPFQRPCLKKKFQFFPALQTTSCRPGVLKVFGWGPLSVRHQPWRVRRSAIQM
jgi:hypothetical protein